VRVYLVNAPQKIGQDGSGFEHLYPPWGLLYLASYTRRELRKEVAAWQKSRNNKNAKINWQFTTEKARIKLSRLYTTLES